MNQQEMIRVLMDAKAAVDAVAPGPDNTELVGQLILASAIEEAGSATALSLTKAGGAIIELSRAIRSHRG